MLSGYTFGGLDMHGMERLPSTLDVETDCIHCAVNASEGAGDRPLIVNVGLDKLNLRIIQTKQFVPSVGVPDATRTENPWLRRCRITRRPRNPVPPNTVTMQSLIAAMT